MSDPYLTEVRWAGTVLRVCGLLSAPGGGDAVELVLRERDGDGLHALPVAVTPPEDDGRVGFEVELDVTSFQGNGPLPHGLWDLSLRWGEEFAPLGLERAPGVEGAPQRRFLPDSTMVSAYFGLPGTLALDVGGEPHPAGITTVGTLAWNDEDEELIVQGHLDFRAIDTPVSGTLTLRERGGDGRVYEVILMLSSAPGGLDYTAAVPMTRAFIDDPLPRGVWDACMILGFAGMHRELRVLAPADPIELQVRRRLLPVHVSSSRAPEPLSITVALGRS